MLKKTVKYTDFNGVERTEELYFNLNKNEIVELSLELPETVTDKVSNNKEENALAIGEKIYESLGKKGLYEFAKKLILKSYGIRMADGKGFKKSKELTEEFENAIAFDTVFMELIENNDAFLEFMSGVNPTIFEDLSHVGD